MKWIAPFGAQSPSERYRNAAPTIAGSNPDAKFFNDVLDELLAVITAANLTPSDTNLHQIADAIVFLCDRAAASGVIKGSFWFGKTLSASSVPAPTAVGQTYIDFTTLNTYISNDGTSWTQSGTFVKPTGIDFTILITSKFWDIVEQTDQQGGDAIYSRSTDSWTYWPKIVNLDNVVHKAGAETITGIKTFDASAVFNSYVNLNGVNTFYGSVTVQNSTQTLIGKNNVDLSASDGMLFSIFAQDASREFARMDFYRRGTSQQSETHLYAKNILGNVAQFSIIKKDDDTENVVATTGVKSVITGWGMPNYAAGVAVTTGQDVQATNNGILVVYGNVIHPGGNDGKFEISINNTAITYVANADPTYGITAPATLFVSKGDTIRITTNYATVSAVLYPCKL